jgi:hypothetical protein
MTYILNAGTDYGTEGETTDFKPTPYGSEELRRITERQRRTPGATTTTWNSCTTTADGW